MKIQYCLIFKNRLWTPALEPEPIIDDTSFNYIDSLRNNKALETMCDHHRTSGEINDIKEEYIRNEVFKMWRLEGQKRSYVRENVRSYDTRGVITPNHFVQLQGFSQRGRYQTVLCSGGD